MSQRPTRDRDRGRRLPREPYEWNVYDHPPPIPVPDGIRAKSKRGDIGETWWSRRFVAALEGYYAAGASRLTRGRSYARAGQVVRMGLEPGLVEAIVQGSRPRPYKVKIGVLVLDDTEWTRVETAMAARAVFLARLLSGEMPNEIEEAFEAASVRLFPTTQGDLKTSCTCPDTVNPCKHIAAVYYLLAESFDANPFLIFEWRGRPRERLIAELRALRPAAPETAAVATRESAPPVASVTEDDLLGRFWHGRPGWAEVHVEPHPSSPPDAVLRDMDAGVANVLGAEAVAFLRGVYIAAARAARRRLDPASTESTDRATSGGRGLRRDGRGVARRRRRGRGGVGSS